MSRSTLAVAAALAAALGCALSTSAIAAKGGHGGKPRPDDPASAEPDPEYIGMGYLDRSGNNTVGVSAMLDADLCASLYAPYGDGSQLLADDLWQACIDPTGLFYLDGLPGGIRRGSWETPDSLITSGAGKRHAPNVYRGYVSGPLAGTSELLIEGADQPNTGL